MGERRRRAYKPWTQEERLHLLTGAGAYGWVWFRRKLKRRSLDAIKSKLHREIGSKSFTRGSYTLAALVRQSGYSPEQLMRAQTALGQKWHRLQTGGARIITEEQSAELTRWLAHDYWAGSRQRYSCVWCGAADKAHKAGGFCQPCYFRHRRVCRVLGIPTALEEQIRVVRYLAGQTPKDHLLTRMQARLDRGVGLDRDWVLGLAARLREWGDALRRD